MIHSIAFSASAGISAGFSAVAVFNRLPPRWLCDYNEEPCEELTSGNLRISDYPWKPIFSVFFFLAALIFSTQSIRYALPALSVLWLLLIIAIADKKYMIIPDQFVVLLAVSAVFYLPGGGSLLSPLYGALLGGGCMLLIGIIGKIIYKKEALGFGDVKLFAALGLITGPIGISIVLMASSLLSCAAFSGGLIRGKIKMTDTLPLGPYIAAAYFFQELFRSTIWLNTFSLSVVSFSSAM